MENKLMTESELKTASHDNQTLCHYLHKKYRGLALWYTGIDIVMTELGERWKEHTYIVVNPTLENSLKAYIKRFTPCACVTFK